MTRSAVSTPVEYARLVIEQTRAVWCIAPASTREWRRAPMAMYRGECFTARVAMGCPAGRRSRIPGESVRGKSTCAVQGPF
jgi:hypothetical protein